MFVFFPPTQLVWHYMKCVGISCYLLPTLLLYLQENLVLQSIDFIFMNWLFQIIIATYQTSVFWVEQFSIHTLLLLQTIHIPRVSQSEKFSMHITIHVVFWTQHSTLTLSLFLCQASFLGIFCLKKKLTVEKKIMAVNVSKCIMHNSKLFFVSLCQT